MLKFQSIAAKLVILALIVQVSRGQSCSDLPLNLTRLPLALIPSHYDLRLVPILEEGPRQFEAPGDVSIELDCVEHTKFIILHSLRIDIDYLATKVIDETTGLDLKVTSQILHDDSQTLQICMEETLLTGRTYKLQLKFRADVSVETLGLYRSSYIHTETQERRWLATTQFQDKHARKAFPCFDEPGFKATFNVSLGKKAPFWHTLSNMNHIEIGLEEIEDMPGYTWDHYNKTVRMSTYILAFIVSDFTYVESVEIVEGVDIRVWAIPEQIESRDKQYAAEVTAKMLNYFIGLFDMPYSINKLDSIAIPDFFYGAMENWGLVTYGPNYLTYVPGLTTENSRRGLISIVAHELGHQWWGNIVSCQWWNDIWLNEGFAIYFDYWGVNAIAEEYKAFDSIVSDSIAPAMDWDLGSTGHPVSNGGDTPGSGHVNHKAACLIRMMESFLTLDTLHRALRNYLQEKAFENAVQDDLFEVIQVQSTVDGVLPPNVSVKQIMDTWTLQTGYPLIRVSSVGEDTLLISQESVHLVPFEVTTTTTPANQNPHQSHLWWVPISYATQSSPDFSAQGQRPKMWMTNTQSVVTHRPANYTSNSWIILNTQSTNYYRVLYDDKLRAQIKAQLDQDPKVISPGSRSELLEDYFFMAYNRYVLMESALELTSFLDKETELVVWKPFLKHSRKFFYLLSSSQPQAWTNLKAYYGPKFEGALGLIGAEQEPNNVGEVVLLRYRLLEWTSRLGGSILTEQYSKKLIDIDTWNTTNPVPVDIQAEMYCAIVAYHSQEGFEFAVQKYKESLAANNSAQKNLWITAIGGCVQDQTLLLSWIEMTLNESSGVVKSDVNLIFEKLSTNFELRHVVFNYVEENIQSIIEYSNSVVPIVSVIRIVKDYFSLPADLNRVEIFIETNRVVLNDYLEQLELYLTTIRSNGKWMDIFGNRIIDYLHDQTQTS